MWFVSLEGVTSDFRLAPGTGEPLETGGRPIQEMVIVPQSDFHFTHESLGSYLDKVRAVWAAQSEAQYWNIIAEWANNEGVSFAAIERLGVALANQKLFTREKI